MAVKWLTRFEDIKPFVSALECLSVFRTDVIIKASNAGIESTAVDAQHVVLMSLAINADSLSYHNVSHEAPQEFLADLKSLIGVLKLAVKRGETSIFKKDDQNASGYMLHAEFQDSRFSISPKQGGNVCPTQDVCIETPSFDQPSDVVLTLSVKEAKRLFKELSKIGGDIRFESNNRHTVCVSCDSGHGRANMSLTEGSAGVVTLESNSSIPPQRFDGNLLQKIICLKSDTGGKEVTLNIRKGLPLEVVHKVGDIGTLKFFLAPKHSTTSCGDIQEN